MWNDCGSMLLKAKLGDVQKFVRITEPNLKDFLIAAFAKFGVPAVTEGVKIVDSSGTELDDDVFEDIIKDPSTGVLTIKYDSESVSMVASSEQSQPSSLDTLDSEDTVIISDSPSRKRQRLDTEAKQLVESALTNKTGGERIINEYNRTKSLTDETRRKMVNMLAADMTEMNGSIIMMARVELGTWPGGLKLFREAPPKTGDHHSENQPKDQLVKTCLEDRLSDENPSLFQRLP
ncbi:uncharacterized protein LOC123491654 isoform X7 [Coregonus clupeaformis]|uniref:uncharacterized protein LOC123483361 n=1 Tax=Coregonus clupeaformis TaxID=59861 RepID=UPI001E1C99D7|nr:uncharacterized protein LOC123483361 [Coregonus clupeaformis]XP_045075002.1 uncharacterized protein LOC121558851 isoform X7 [Coregonus clupeaformis]XP_045079181.1 uncharacterized protein LOC123491654 isoform X7 [Coregonus clupeaformis]